MRKAIATIALIVAAQVAAVGLGVAWGLGLAPGLRWLHGRWALAGGLALFLLGVEGLYRLASRRLRASRPVPPWICMALGCYAAWLMWVEAFLWYIDDSSFIRGLLLMLPFLLALGPLIRIHAWLYATGSALFFATSLAMLIRNATSRGGGSGFFAAWVS